VTDGPESAAAGECTEAEQVITATAAARGWTQEDCIRLLCEYIEEQELTGDLFLFVAAQPHPHEQATGREGQR
jgi:hypothetical protein